MKFNLRYTDKALQDAYKLNYYIEIEKSMPLSAKRYMMGLEEKIKCLTEYGDIFPIIPELTIELKREVRRLNYKKVAVFYTIDDNCIIIQRIMPSSLVRY